jgi:Predicted membrane protein (DUF2207)
MWPSQLKSPFSKFLILPVLAAFFGLASPVFAENRSYSIDQFNTVISVKADSTADVTENQTFTYRGTYHEGYREIPTAKVDTLSDFSVTDGATGQVYAYSLSALDLNDPNSWGKFTVQDGSGSKIISWYYDVTDTTKVWILKYKVHGAITFGKDQDGLYWNIFTGYDVPIAASSVEVIIPGKPGKDEVKFQAYRTQSLPVTQEYKSDEGKFIFSGTNFSPQEAFTVDTAWPKGLVSQQAYFLDLARQKIWLVLALLVPLVGFTWAFLYKRRREAAHGPIVAEYGPPANLPPAMGQAIAQGAVNDIGWSATIVDLAVKGYLKIKEEGEKGFIGSSKDYAIELVKDYKNSRLEDYEKEFINILFAGGKSTSTKNLKDDKGLAKELKLNLELLKDKVYAETDLDTDAFDDDRLIDSLIKSFLSVALFALIAGLYFDAYGLVIFILQNQALLFVGSIVLTIVAVIKLVKMPRRLTEHGWELRRQWQGFKLYLETAEKYRLQNLTPEAFEKYLPYAMIFGVEKKWAKSFEIANVSLSSPIWYVPYYGSGFGGIPASSFSPVSFSSSLSSSFTSSFSSSAGISGGGFAGGGGGGAGGGGGGGGGGAR